jgi:hypothetical protein
LRPRATIPHNQFPARAAPFSRRRPISENKKAAASGAAASQKEEFESA